MKSASKDDNARSIRNRVSTQGYYCQTHYRMLQFLLLPMPDTVMQIFFLWQSGRQCTGMAAVPLQRKTGRDQREEKSEENQLWIQEKEGQPQLKPPCFALGRSFRQGHHVQCLWVGPEPRQPNRQEDGSGLKTLTLHFVLRNVPCPLHQPFPELMLPFLFVFPEAS